MPDGTEEERLNQFPVLDNLQLRGLYGAVMRNIASIQTYPDFDPKRDQVMYGVAERMREEITRRTGEGWLTKWHQA